MYRPFVKEGKAERDIASVLNECRCDKSRLRNLWSRESVSLAREFGIAEKSYGTDHLDLVPTYGYLGELLGNARVVRYLAQHHRDILNEFQKLAETETVAA